MKVKREDGTVEFEGTPKECGIYCREKDKREELKRKTNKPREESRFTKLFSNPIFIG